MAQITIDYGDIGSGCNLEISDYSVGLQNRYKIARIGKYRFFVQNSQYNHDYMNTSTLQEIDRPKNTIRFNNLIYTTNGSDMYYDAHLIINADGTMDSGTIYNINCSGLYWEV